ncbi:MAG: DNA-protecting protein DprA [Candidatus Nealsonbacteria bacterium]|nr:MAG: DNA-protecting protein DprA [Candidatus Nealsonbacteria bacterium]
MSNFLLPFEIKKVSIEDDFYPKLLKGISGAPKILYWRGELKKEEERCFAIVGTRRSSEYGKEIAFSIAQDLSGAGLTIVSGMARGIDSMAHKGALEGSGRTIAVLGTGLDEKSIYPQENLKLAKTILKNGGCLISEYPPGTRGTQFTFPERNRIISGLSLGVLVVEAKTKSGALITAEWARKQGKKVFAIPGSIHSLNSRGCHLLIKRGAKLVETVNDILEELHLPKIKKEKITGETLEENLILEVLKNGSLHIEKIVEKTNLPPQKVSATLSLMEVEGKVRNLGGSIYTLSG